MQPGWNACNATGDDLACFRGEPGKKFRIGVHELLNGDVHAATWHLPVCTAEVDEAFFGLGLHEWEEKRLADLAVQSAALEEGIEFHLLKTAWRTLAFLVASGHIA